MNESPFAHRIARTPKKTPAPERRTTPTIGAGAPAREESPAPVVTPAREPVVVTAPAPASTPETAPVVTRAESGGMRQTLVAVVAFIATTLVLLLAVVVWKLVLAK